MEHAQRGIEILLSVLTSALASLAERRPLFHSEADFQHELAWELRGGNPALQLRLERPMSQKSGYIDLLVLGEAQHHATGIELKLHKDSLSYATTNECFEYSGNAPLDGSRSEFWNDVSRLERWVHDNAMRAGFAVMLTNSPDLWDPAKVRDRPTNDHAFRMHEGSTVTGQLDYIGSSIGKYGESKIVLTGQYACRWRPYSRVGPEPTKQFKYLVIEVPGATD